MAVETTNTMSCESLFRDEVSISADKSVTDLVIEYQ